MNWIRKIRSHWRRTPEVPLSVSVRNALRVVVYGCDITDEQFEALYCAILENEIDGHRDVAEIIDNFFKFYDIKVTK